MKTNPSPLYFAYGSNLNTEQMRSRCPGSQILSSAKLRRYRLAFGGDSSYRKGGVATILPNPNGFQVEGVIYQMTATDWTSLDRWEAYPDKYGRRDVLLTDPQGKEVAAITYFLNEFYPNSPSKEYLGIIEKAYQDHGLDTSLLTQALKTEI